MYSELIGNYKKYRIKSLYGNKLTIQSPSNMIRQFKNNLQEAGMVLGQLFMPLLQKVLPVINGVTIAIKRLLVSIAGFLGISLDLSSFGQGYSDMADDASGLSDSLDDATASAKKLKTATLGIDELNINAPQDDASGSGAFGGGIDLTDEILTATEEYNKVWQEAFDKMESRAQAFADTFEKMFKPIRNIIEDISYGIKFDDEAWFKVAGMDVSNLVVSIFDTFTTAIESVDWEQVGKNIGAFLSGINWTEIFISVGNSIWAGLNAAIDIAKGMFSVAPIETAIIGGILGISLLGKISGFITTLTTTITKFIAPITNIFTTLGGAISGLGAVFAGLSTPVLVAVGAISALVAGLGITFAKNEDVRKSFADATNVIGQNLKPLLDVFTKQILPDLKDGWNGVLQTLKPLGDFISGVFVDIWQNMLNPALSYFGTTLLPLLTQSISNLWNNFLVPLGELLVTVFSPVIQVLSSLLTILWQNILVPLAEFIASVFTTAFVGLVTLWNESLLPVINFGIEAFTFLWQEVLVPIGTMLVEEFQPIFETVFGAIKGVIEGAQKIFTGFINFITGVFTGNWEKAWNGVKDIFKGIFNGLASIVEGVVNLIIDGINEFTSGFRGLVTEFGDIIGIDITIPDIPHISIPTFQTGGFPEDGLFFANHNELVGQFSNGKTAVANNEQIVAGIKEGVREAVSEILAPYLSDIAQNTRETADKDFSVNIGDRDIARANARGQRSLGYSLVT